MKNVPLFWRGVVLIGFPIACQMIFVMVLGAVLFDIQGRLEHESASLRLMCLANTLVRKTSEDYFLNTLDHETDFVHKRYQLRLLKLKSDQLLDGIRRDPAQKKHAKDLERQTADAIKLLDSSMPKSPDDTWRIFTPSFHNAVRRQAPQYYDTLSAIVETAAQESQGDVNLTNRLLNSLQYLIVCALTISVLLAMTLGYYYTISILGPLRQLNETARRLSAREELSSEIDDTTEFLKIDRAMHLASTELERAFKREQDVIGNAVDLICSIDADGIFLKANPYSERLLGVRSEELVGRSVADFTVPEEIPHLLENISLAMRSATVIIFELSMSTVNHCIVTTKWSCLFSSEHKILFCIVSDISDEKRVGQLKQDFLDTVSQDLQKPLSAMQESLNLVLSGQRGALSSQAEAILRKTSKSISRLVLLTNDLLDFQKITGGKLQIETALCDLKDIALESIDCVSVLAEPKGVVVNLEGESSCVVSCDRMKVLQTVVNLLSNAIKFSPEKSAITVKISQTAEWTELSVIDAGPGVPLEYQEKIFEPFQQVPSAKAKLGTGLGLAICKMIMEAHRGSISVVSNQSESHQDQASGSEFTIKLPR